MLDAFGLKFVILFMSIGQICFAQEGKIRVFEKKFQAESVANNKEMGSLFLVLFPSKENVLVAIDQNKAWEVTAIDWQEWNELPESTLMVVQPLVDDNLKGVKRNPEPIRLGSLSLKDFKRYSDQNLYTFSITWSMDTLYPAETSVQTSRKIELSNCCDKGTCSILISFARKKDQIQLYTVK